MKNEEIENTAQTPHSGDVDRELYNKSRVLAMSEESLISGIIWGQECA